MSKHPGYWTYEDMKPVSQLAGAPSTLGQSIIEYQQIDPDTGQFINERLSESEFNIRFPPGSYRPVPVLRDGRRFFFWPRRFTRVIPDLARQSFCSQLLTMVTNAYLAHHALVGDYNAMKASGIQLVSEQVILQAINAAWQSYQTLKSLAIQTGCI